MKKTYKIDVDCANCANLMEDAARKTSGVQSATVNFMTLKMNVEFEGRSGSQGCYAGGSQSLQEGGTRLRDISVSQRNEMPCRAAACRAFFS